MTPHATIAVAFATALVEGNYERAHQFLTPSLQQQLTPEDLRDNFYGMFRLYAIGEPKAIWHDEAFDQASWAEPGDMGWVYVSIKGDDFLEAVAVTVTDVDGVPRIREIIWGRP